MRFLHEESSEHAAARQHAERCTSQWRCGPVQGDSAMILRFFDQQDESNSLNGSIIADSEQLSRILDSLRTRKPFFAELFGENGYNLLIGIGEAVGCVQYSRADGKSAYLVAVAPKPIAEDGYVEFLIGDTSTPISVRYILPFEEVKAIATYFLETGARSARFNWEDA
jgi:hypothetical protein